LVFIEKIKLFATAAFADVTFFAPIPNLASSINPNKNG